MKAFFNWIKGIKVWYPSNIYRTARIGRGTTIGMFSEIGNHVIIGKKCSIGAYAFIPEGTIIGDNVFIGPRYTGSNDMYPPSDKNDWDWTYIHDGAAIGANVSIRPGVTIGCGATIGMGAVVTKDVPAHETWVGVPAKKLVRGRRNGA